MERRTLLEKALFSASTDRPVAEYLNDLSLEYGDLKGTVLDLGSGIGELFSREASLVGIKVVSVNPKLAVKAEREKRKDVIENYGKIRKHDQKRSIASLAQALPFPDNTFDTVVSLYAVPLWIDQNKKSFNQVFCEIHRILKPRGNAYLGPAGSRRMLKTVLNNLNFQYEIRLSRSDEDAKKRGQKLVNPSYNIHIFKGF